MKKNEKGFTLMELVVAVSILTVLIGILVPSLNAVTDFRVRRTAESIGAALDRTKAEAMNRLVGEMMLERRSDGYYISYYLDRGKEAAGHEVKEDQPEKIGPSRLVVSYATTKSAIHEMTEGEKLILTYDREDGSFRPIQTEPMNQEKINEFLADATDIPFFDGDGYCTEIRVQGGGSTRILTMDPKGGTYKLTAG